MSQTHPSLLKKIPELQTSPLSAWSMEMLRHRTGQLGTAPGDNIVENDELFANDLLVGEEAALAF